MDELAGPWVSSEDSEGTTQMQMRKEHPGVTQEVAIEGPRRTKGPLPCLIPRIEKDLGAPWKPEIRERGTFPGGAFVISDHISELS